MTRTQAPIRYGLIAAFLSVFVLVYIASAHPFSLSFSSNENRWQVVLDGVMGGLSTGKVDRTSDGIVFHGELSLENNGGFSQIRTPVEMGSLDGADGIEVEVRGDGRAYIFDARVANLRVMAGSFQHKFETVEGEWTTIRLPFTDFRFHAFGQRVPGVGAIAPAMVDSVGVTLADYNAGDFRLEIRSVRGYSARDEYENRLAKLNEQLGLSKGAGAVVERDESRVVYAGRLARLQEELLRREAERGSVVAVDRSYASRVVELCVLAVERGAPLFNKGQHEACASVYELALVSISHLSGEALGDHGRSIIDEAIAEGRRLQADERAWRYRAALDRLVQMFSAHA